MHIGTTPLTTPQTTPTDLQVQQLLTEAHYKHLQKQQRETGGVAGGVADLEQESPPVVIRSRRMSKRISVRESMRESVSEMDRQLKKLFRAIQDGDTNLVRGGGGGGGGCGVGFGWAGTRLFPVDL